MPKGNNQKLKLYRLYQYLLRKTDETHGVTIQEIADELERYGITSNRKSLYRDIDESSIMGIKVEGRKAGRNYFYHVIEKQFELAELKLLVDAIQSAKFISEKKSRGLIKKLEGFASEYEANQLQRQVVMSGRVKTMNESIYYSVDEIHRAIGANQRITFQYWKWNINKEMELKRNGEQYEVSPWALTWDDENYYLIAFDEKEQKIKHYRVDKMKNITMIDALRNGRDYFEKFDVASYVKKSFGMFGGPEEKVKLRVENEYVGVIIDRFGKDVMIMPDDENHFIVHVDVMISNQFYAWVFGLATGVKILSPQRVANEYYDLINRVGNLYNE